MSEKKMPHTQSDTRPPQAGRRGDPNEIISQKLNALFSAVEQEGIPDRFLTLLEQLDEAERRQSQQGASDE